MPDTDDCRHIVFYGSLMADFPTQDHVGVRAMVALVRPCLVWGRLYDLGSYPGLAPGQRRVAAELYRLVDPAALALLDRFEDYDPLNPGGSEYLRQCASLADGSEQAWVYYFNRPTEGLRLIEGDSWAAHLGRRRADQGFWRDFLGQRPDPVG
ncbi:AIG2 family protein [Desulfarculus baarsii DSM 2075]|uniref:AIG2 family protein n=1 Tax=Desulfarculus baarsii (strain ATCC 33931 / DSM 2075 / LMG 7858 / VKM B-1802 / 2st14) TaxID=644282 RepID=E1QFS2_DESB2|nr:gamma-glutamylcyclotransferase family protein [Desulfarculus baarsii]ADK84408.1 AIG2 family protein [Desulfarculus baarsii DSM 2075]